MEITTYLEQSLTSELSANVIDLCPVGALTSRPYAYHARPWELKKTESIDVLDAVGSNIRVDVKGREVMRVLPRNHDDVNEEWISDKTRYACDGLKAQRLDKPYVKKSGKLQAVSWDEALQVVADKLNDAKSLAAIAGDQVDAESMFALQELFKSLGSENLDCRQDNAKIDASNRSSYLFNSTIAGIDEADAILIIGSDVRKEAPILNARIRKAFLNGAKVANIGDEFDFTYNVEQVGKSADDISGISATKGFGKILKAAKNPIIIVGSAVLASEAAQVEAQKLAKKFGAKYNVIHNAASRVAGLDLGFVSDEGVKKADVVYLLAADEIDMNSLKGKFVIYQGHHGDAGAHAADVILPGAAYTEKSGTYLNLEGRAQQTTKAVFAPGDAREDWKILRALSEVVGKKLAFDSLDELRGLMYLRVPHFANLDEIEAAEFKVSSTKKKLTKSKFQYPVSNFYMTCPISRNSKTMAECVDQILDGNTKSEAA